MSDYRNRIFFKGCESMAEIPDGVVQTCVTSPPYFNLRDYEVEGQIGLEPTVDAYVERLVGVFREVRRVLRDDGTLWLNLGDSYACSPVGSFNGGGFKDGSSGRDMSGVATSGRRDTVKASGLKQGDLIGAPWLEVNGSLHVPLYTVTIEDRWISPDEAQEQGLKFFGFPEYGNEKILLPAGSVGFLRRTCTTRFKTELVESEARFRGWKADGYELWLGFTVDEIQRVKPSKLDFVTTRWPFLEIDWTRARCEAYLLERNQPITKSACVFCPFKSWGKWNMLNGADRERAIEAREIA